jgi:hypothetical protein
MAESEEARTKPPGRPHRIRQSILKLEFGQDKAFESDVRRRVNEYFDQERGRSRQGALPMYLKTGIIFASLVAFYLLLAFAASNIDRRIHLTPSCQIELTP